MSQTVQLTGAEHAERLLPLLKEYADKLQHLFERASEIEVQMWSGYLGALAPEATRTICMIDAVVPHVTGVCRTASGLLEHAELESSLWTELKLRLDETEEHVRFSKVVVAGLVSAISQEKRTLQEMRTLVEKTGRYKAPF
jgi:hypothetical protein